MKILVTGTVGFIGFHRAKRLLEDGHEGCWRKGVRRFVGVVWKIL